MKGMLYVNDRGRLELDGVELEAGQALEVLHGDQWVPVRVERRPGGGFVGEQPGGETIDLAEGMNARPPAQAGVGPGIAQPNQ